MTAFWYVKVVTVGPRLLLLFMAVLLSAGLLYKRTRPLVIVFGIAFGLFVLLPVVISLKKPILAGRYWMIGAPGLIVVLAR